MKLMRVRLTFSSETPLTLSTCYNRAIQGCIYSLMNSDFASWLHDEGFRSFGRSFKLFTFSRLFGTFIRKGDLINFISKVHLYISSPVETFIEQLCNNLLKSKVQLETNPVKVESIEFLKKPHFCSAMIVNTLSPITVYSTLFTPQGNKKTYYYSPYEREFSTLIKQNLLKKAQILEVRSSEEFNIEPFGKIKDVYIDFKGTVVRGWKGRFKVQGDPALVEIGYETGFGSKNSAGFGMIDVIENV
jgi:CRISPR-associated endoribonuclease Cas6